MDIYGTYNVSTRDAVNDFVELCKQYGGDNEYNANKFISTSSTASYSINNGDDKPMMIMLVGNITNDIYKEIDEKLKASFKLSNDSNTYIIDI